MSARTRSRRVAWSTLTLKSCGPRSLITSRWTLFFSSANGSDIPDLGLLGARTGESLSWRSIMPPY